MANFNLNKVILGGRLTADPELKQTPNDIAPVEAFKLKTVALSYIIFRPVDDMVILLPLAAVCIVPPVIVEPVIVPPVIVVPSISPPVMLDARTFPLNVALPFRSSHNEALPDTLLEVKPVTLPATSPSVGCKIIPLPDLTVRTPSL